MFYLLTNVLYSISDTVVFDNSNSYFRNKRIRYYVTLGFNVDETIDLPLGAYESDS